MKTSQVPVIQTAWALDIDQLSLVLSPFQDRRKLKLRKGDLPSYAKNQW